MENWRNLGLPYIPDDSDTSQQLQDMIENLSPEQEFVTVFYPSNRTLGYDKRSIDFNDWDRQGFPSSPATTPNPEMSIQQSVNMMSNDPGSPLSFEDHLMTNINNEPNFHNYDSVEVRDGRNQLNRGGGEGAGATRRQPRHEGRRRRREAVQATAGNTSYLGQDSSMNQMEDPNEDDSFMLHVYNNVIKWPK